MRIFKTILMLSLFLLPGFGLAENSSEIETKIEEVRREREVLLEEEKKLKLELDALNRESQTLGTVVKSLDATRKKLANDISLTQSKISSTNLTISNLENSMSEKERQIFAHREALADILQSLSEHNSRSILFDFLAAVKFSDAWRDRTQLESLNARMNEEIKALRETRAKLSAEREARERIKKEQLSLQGQLSGQKSVVEENKKAKERLLAQTKSTEAEYQKLLADNRERQRQFEADLFQLESGLKINIDSSLVPEPRPGLLAWPLTEVFITQRFGVTSDSKRLYRSGTHNGVDFRAAMGTPIKAVLSGVVEGTGNTDADNPRLRREGKPICGSYGRWVMIRHGNGLTSVYAHLSVALVKAGQTVETGEVIGYSGGTPGVDGSGYSTGPHLHLALFASQGVEIRQFTTSLNCKHTIVPIADIKAYLDPLAYLPTL